MDSLSLAPRTADSGQRGSSLTFFLLDKADECTARVLFSYAKDEENELELEEGEVLEGIEMVDEGWWSGISRDGRSGLFPCAFVLVSFFRWDERG